MPRTKRYTEYSTSLTLKGTSSPPISPSALEAAAARVLAPDVLAYLSGGAGAEITLRENRAAFDEWHFIPRLLNDVSEVDISTSLMGQAQIAPIITAPVGAMAIVSPGAEKAVAHAATAVGITMCMSTSSSSSIEDVAAALSPRSGWYQLYWPNDESVGSSIVQRAEAAGFTAIVITLDNRVPPFRPSCVEAGYSPLTSGDADGVYTSDPVFQALAPERQAASDERLRIFATPKLTWKDIAAVRRQIGLPTLFKGVLTAADAERCIECGASGIIVSNHGGRQVDRCVAALRQLPEVVMAVRGRVPVLFDSGIRTGSDILMAVGLGASAVLIGRPIAWALAVSGQAGVEHLLRCLLADIEASMCNLGVSCLRELRDVVHHSPMPAPSSASTQRR
jgi:lactate 2-monooxygenase